MPKLYDAWTAEERAANRRGELPPSQLAKILEGNRKTLVVACVSCGVGMGGAGGAFAGLLEPSLGWIALGVVCGLIVAIPIVALLVATISGPFRDRPTAVVPLTGMLEVEELGYKRQRSVYSIAGHRVEALYRGFDELVGRKVTLYKLTDSRMVIAAEPPA